jgi:tetratricopeptide (TPR) repeat protein
MAGGMFAGFLLIAASLVVVRDWRGEYLLQRGKALLEAQDSRGESLLVKSLAHGNAGAALELAIISFERQEWDRVHLFADEALNINPYLPYAYVLKAYAMAEEKMPSTSGDAERIVTLCGTAVGMEPAGGAWWRSCAELSLRVCLHLHPEGPLTDEAREMRSRSLDFYRKALALGGRESGDIVRSAAALGPDALFLVEGLREAPYPAVRETVTALLEGDVWWAVRVPFWEMAGAAEEPRDFYRGAVDALREGKRYQEVLSALEHYDMREREDAPLAWAAALSAEALGMKSDAWTTAEKHFRTAARLDKEKRYFRRRLGLHLEKLGKLEEAAETLALLTSEDPRDHTSWFHLARIARKKGNRDEAVRALRKAVELEPDNDSYRKNLKIIEQEP